jgi:PAS domain S-box-containing protein
MVICLLGVNLLILLPNRIDSLQFLLINAGFCLIATLIAYATSYIQRLNANLQECRQALLENQKRMAGIVDSTIDAIICIDAELRIILYNTAAVNMFGYSKQEALGITIERLIPEWFRRRQDYPSAAGSGGNGALPFRNGETIIINGLRSNGIEFPIEASVSQLETADSTSFTAVLRDVTERMRIEFALQERLKLQDQITKVANTAPGLICAFRLRPDHSACMPYASPVIEAVYGFKPHEVITDFSPVFARIHPEDIEHLQAGIAESAASMRPWQDTYRYFHPSKGEVWLEGHSMPLREADGSILWHGYIQDITERKRAETALRDRDAELRLIMDATPALISYLNVDLCYQRVNATYEHWFGLSAQQVLGQNARDLVGEKSWEIIGPYLEKALAGEQVEFDQAIPYGNSAPRWVHATYIPHKNANGQVKGIVVHATDIQARKLYEHEIAVLNKNLQHRIDELRSSQTRLALIVEEVNAGYWDWDLLTRTLYLSPEWKRQLGFDDHELINSWEEWECLLHPEDRPYVWVATEHFIAGHQQAYELEYRLRHKNGAYRWIHARGSLLRDHDNRPYRLLGINLDITDYMKSKALSARRDKMEQAFRLYVAGQTAAAIAHELNQPLTAIGSYADVALQLLESGKPDPQKLHHVIENCSIQAQRAGQVIRQLLACLHKGETLVEPIDLNDIIREALELMETDLDHSGLNLELNLAADLRRVAANGMQIQKVLLNLLRNGLEAMLESELKSGTLTINTSTVNDHPGMARVSIRDCGKGVADPAGLNSIFQAFYTTKPTGLGMGLAISRSLIEAHGGELWAEQNAGQGLSIHFTLPFAT